MPDTPLFEISSPDFTTAQKEFFQTRSAKELAQKKLGRKKDLLQHGVGSQKELEEAISALQIAEKEYENAYSALQVYQVAPERMTLGQPLIVRSPIAGQVIADNTEISHAFFQFEAAKQKLEQYQSGLLDETGKILDGMMYRYKRGETTIIKVLLAQRTYNDVREQYLDTKKEYSSAFIELQRSCGGWIAE